MQENIIFKQCLTKLW